MGTAAISPPELDRTDKAILRALQRDASVFAGFEKAAANVSGCMECHVVTGEFDDFKIVRTLDNESFNRLHAEQLLHLPGLRQVRSFKGPEQVGSTTQPPIRSSYRQTSRANAYASPSRLPSAAV